MKNVKKSQVTLFIILGILVLSIATASIYYTTQSNSNNSVEKIENKAEFENKFFSYTNECLKEESEKALSEVGVHGGYYQRNSTDTLMVNGTWRSYHYRFENDISPSKNEVEDNINSYIEDNIEECITSFNNYQEGNITMGEIQVSSNIIKDNVRIESSIPIKIVWDSRVKTREDFQVTYSSKLYKMINIKDDLLSIQLEDPDKLPLSTLTDLAYNNSLSWSIQVQNRTSLLTLNTQSDNIEPKNFSFALSYE